jgi:predicted nucleic acid-binding protein
MEEPLAFLVDADVLSEMTKPRPAAAVIHWLNDNDERNAVNPIILAELKYGILTLPHGRRRMRLERWFDEGVANIPVLDIDANTAHVWAALNAELTQMGRAMPVNDSLIAASARQYGLTVATRNVRHYRHAGVSVVDPFSA